MQRDDFYRVNVLAGIKALVRLSLGLVIYVDRMTGAERILRNNTDAV